MELMPVEIKYLKIGSKNWDLIYLPPEEFFDVDEYKKETVFDFIEKEFLEPRNLVHLEFYKIEKLILTAKDNIGNEKITQFTYWADGVNQLNHTIEISNNMIKNETIIISTHNNHEQNILRFDKVGDSWDLITDTNIM